MEEQEDFYESHYQREDRERNELIQAAYLGEDYHLKNLPDYKAGKFKWNWAIFFLGINWFLWKGVFAVGVGYVIGMLVLGFGIGLIPNAAIALSLIMGVGILEIVTRFLLIAFGNRLYYRAVTKRVDKLIFAEEDQDVRLSRIGKEKRIRRIIGVVLIILVAVLGVWGELDEPSSVEVDVYIENLNEEYVFEERNLLTDQFNGLVESIDVMTTEDILQRMNEDLIPRQEAVLKAALNLYPNDEQMGVIHQHLVDSLTFELQGMQAYSKYIEYGSEVDFDQATEAFDKAEDAFAIFIASIE